MEEKTTGQKDTAQSDTAYERMFEAARERFAGRDPARIAELSGAKYDRDRSLLRIISLGEEISLSWPALTPVQPVENWQMLVILHYLDLADGTEPTGELFSFRDMINGMIRGGKFEFTAARSFQRILKGQTEENMLRACRKLGGEKIPGKGDLTVKFFFLPKIPVTMSFWFADEEFPASGHMYPDRTIDHYLQIEDAVTVGEILLNRLEKNL